MVQGGSNAVSALLIGTSLTANRGFSHATIDLRGECWGHTFVPLPAAGSAEQETFGALSPPSVPVVLGGSLSRELCRRYPQGEFIGRLTVGYTCRQGECYERSL